MSPRWWVWVTGRWVTGRSLQQAAPDDHALDVGGALADQQHGRLAVEPLDLEVFREAVAAVDAEGILDDVAAVLRREVLGHSGLRSLRWPASPGPRRAHDHLVGSLHLRAHLGDAEQHCLVLRDGFAERLALLGVGDAEFEARRATPTPRAATFTRPTRRRPSSDRNRARAHRQGSARRRSGNRRRATRWCRPLVAHLLDLPGMVRPGATSPKPGVFSRRKVVRF